MFKLFMIMNAFFGIIITILSFYKKDYINCVNKNGEEFAKKRKRIMRLLGIFLLIFPSIILIVDL